MKKSLIALMACTLFISPSFVNANSPPPFKTLPERVELSTHVIIGTAIKVTVVEFKDGRVQEITPEPPIILPYEQIVEVEVEVEESLYPLKWKPKKIVRYFFGGGFFEPEGIRKDTLGKKYIYLMQSNPYEELKNEDDIFFPSYGWNLVEALEKKTEIQAMLAERVKRETEAKAGLTANK